MTASKTAKNYGAKSLTQVSEFSGYSVDTLSRMNRAKHYRFKALCVAAVCDELGLDGVTVRDLNRIISRL